MSVFHRAFFQQVAFTFVSGEALGLLDTAYIEDDQGVDGQVAVVHVESGARHELLLTGLDAEHERFRGFLALDGLPNGEYRVLGRVRDIVGNQAVLNLGFSLAGGLGTVLRLPGLHLAGVATGVGAISVRPRVGVPASKVTGPAIPARRIQLGGVSNAVRRVG